MQKKVKYETMVSPQSHGLFSEFINKKYYNSLVWPLIWYRNEKNSLTVDTITFEVNRNNINNYYIDDNHYILKVIEDTPVYKTNYNKIKEERIEKLNYSNVPNFIKESVEDTYTLSHEYVTSVEMKPPIYTIDIDYLWYSSFGTEALEVSTFYSEIYSRKRGIYLIKKFIEERASKKNAHQFKLLVKVCEEIFKARLRMVFFQTEKETANIVPGSNVVWFELDSKQAELIHRGSLPQNIRFESIKNFLKYSL